MERYTYDTYGAVTIESVPGDDVDYSGFVNGSDRGFISANIGNACDNGPIYDLDDSGIINASDRAFVDTGQGIAELYGGSAFGNRFLFTGRWLDIIYDSTARYDHKLQYNRARHYDAQMGRWLQRDPLGYVDGGHLYLYSAGNPVVLIDSIGLMSQEGKPGAGQPTCFDIPGCVPKVLDPDPEPPIPYRPRPPEGVRRPPTADDPQNCVGEACGLGAGEGGGFPGWTKLNSTKDCTEQDWAKLTGGIGLEGCESVPCNTKVYTNPNKTHCDCECDAKVTELVIIHLRWEVVELETGRVVRHRCDGHAFGREPCKQRLWRTKFGKGDVFSDVYDLVKDTQ